MELEFKKPTAPLATKSPFEDVTYTGIEVGLPIAPIGVPLGIPPLYKVSVQKKPVPPPPLALPGSDLPRAINYLADYSGCGWWRLGAPEVLLNYGQKMIINSLTTMIVDPRFYMSGFCAIKLQRQATPVQKEFVKFLKYMGKQIQAKIIYEVDDVVFHEDIPLYNRCRVAFVDKEIRQSIEEMMEMTDEFCVVSEYMKNYYASKIHNKKITVLPNYAPRMWFDRFYNENRSLNLYNKNKKRPKILITGSGTHYDVINATNQQDDYSHVLQAITKSRKDYEWIFMGGYPLLLKPFIDNGEMIFKDWSPLMYFAKGMHDVGAQATIAALADNNFNRAKCLTGDTKLITVNGIKNISELYNKQEKNLKIWQEYDYKKVSGFIKYDKQPTIKIITENGYEIEGTFTHKIRSNGVFKQLQDFKKDDTLDLGFFEYPNLNYQHITAPLFLTKKLDKINIQETNENLLPKITINERWGRFIGYVLGDGCLYGSNAIGISCFKPDKDIINDLIKFAKEIGVTTTNQIKKTLKNGILIDSNGIDIKFNSRNLKYVLQKIMTTFNGKRYEKTFEVPKIIFNSPKTVIREFISALFETDGTVCDINSKCSLTSKSEKLIKQIQFLLLGFNIISHIKIEHNKKYNKNYYTLILNRQACDVFQKEIGFLSERKKALLVKICNKTHSNAYKKWELKDQIKEIVLSNNDVYDIEVPDNNYYLANGIISHNSFIKLTESGHLGIPFVGQDMQPYENAFHKFTTGDEMIDQLKLIFQDEDSYMKEVKQCRKYADDFWLDDHLDEHIAIYTTKYGEDKRKELAPILVKNNPEQFKK